MNTGIEYLSGAKIKYYLMGKQINGINGINDSSYPFKKHNLHYCSLN